MNPEERLLTVREVAELLRLSTHTVRLWLQTGKLRGLRVGRRWRVRESDLHAFLKAAETADKEGGKVSQQGIFSPLSSSGGMKASAKQILDFFSEQVSKLFFEDLQRPLWKNYPNHLSDPVEALALFLEGYAYERNVSPKSYKSTAAATVMELRTLEQPRLWEEYASRLRSSGKKPNPQCDPLYHTDLKCSCVVCMFGKDNIVRLAKEGLEAGNIRGVHRKLDSVRGIGGKIASVFLRDVAVYFGLTKYLKNVEDRWLLQPVDLWVRRTVSILARAHSMNDKEMAQWIVENASEPERANQGIWYFGSRIVRSEEALEKALRNPETVRALFEDHCATVEEKPVTP